MTFDAETFAASMRRALTGTLTDAAPDAPTPTPAPAPEPAALEAKCSDGPYRWRLVPERDADHLITSVVLEPVARVTVE